MSVIINRQSKKPDLKRRPQRCNSRKESLTKKHLKKLSTNGELKESKRDFEEASNAATGEGRIAAFAKAAGGIAGGFT